MAYFSLLNMPPLHRRQQSANAIAHMRHTELRNEISQWKSLQKSFFLAPNFFFSYTHVLGLKLHSFLSKQTEKEVPINRSI